MLCKHCGERETIPGTRACSVEGPCGDAARAEMHAAAAEERRVRYTCHYCRQPLDRTQERQRQAATYDSHRPLSHTVREFWCQRCQAYVMRHVPEPRPTGDLMSAFYGYPSNAGGVLEGAAARAYIVAEIGQLGSTCEHCGQPYVTPPPDSYDTRHLKHEKGECVK